jgi:hypothetical protein
MKTPIMTDSKPETIGSKVIDQTADTLGSQINISIPRPSHSGGCDIFANLGIRAGGRWRATSRSRCPACIGLPHASELDLNEDTAAVEQ